jgi:hypothetical protein
MYPNYPKMHFGIGCEKKIALNFPAHSHKTKTSGNENLMKIHSDENQGHDENKSRKFKLRISTQ